MIQNYQYFSLTSYNNTSEIIPKLHLGCERSLILPESSTVSLVKFYIDNSLIPVFIPKLDYIPLWFNNDFYSTNNIQINTIPKTDLSTNMHFAISYTKNGQKIIWRSAVDFIPQNEHLSKPAMQPPRSELINNPFYHVYSSIHLLKMLNASFNNVCDQAFVSDFTPTTTYTFFILIQKLYNFMFDSKFQQITDLEFHFNNELSQMFGFVYKPSSILVNYKSLSFDYAYLNTYNDMYVNPEVNRQMNTIFPFVKLVFATNIQVEPLNVFIQAYDGSNNQNPIQISNIITDYDFAIENVDDFYNTITYQSQNFDRQVMILTTYFPNLLFYARCMTHDGLLMDIPQRPGAYSNLYLAFLS